MISTARVILRIAALAGLLPPLLACSATKFDLADGARIKAIALPKPEEPEYFAYSYFVQKQDPILRDDKEDFNTLMQGQKLHLGAELSAAVAQVLRDDGYQILEDGDADAVMKLKIGGFLPGQPGVTYSSHGAEVEPEFMVRATLTDSKTQRKLFEQLYLFANNSIKPMDGTIMLVPDPKYYFTADKDVFKNPELAAAGLRSVIPLVANHIATSLKKQ